MRTVSLLAPVFLGTSALGAVPGMLTCERGPLGTCGNKLVWPALLFLLGFCGFILALIASIQGIAKTVKKRQWGWLLGLVIGVLGPLPACFALSNNLINSVYGPDVLQTLLPFSVRLLLTPVAALVYGLRFPRGQHQSAHRCDALAARGPCPRLEELRVIKRSPTSLCRFWGVSQTSMQSCWWCVPRQCDPSRLGT